MDYFIVPYQNEGMQTLFDNFFARALFIVYKTPGGHL